MPTLEEAMEQEFERIFKRPIFSSMTTTASTAAEDSVLTIEKINRSMRQLMSVPKEMLRPTNIIQSVHALEETEERLFPVSRHRSRRIRKKLIKRFGGEYRKKPCIWKTPDGYVCHPATYRKLVSNIMNKQ